MKKAIVVALNVNDLSGKKKEQASENAVAELNQHLAEGWNVIHSFAMSGTANITTTSVVILEKD